jgi:hypothetical protein
MKEAVMYDPPGYVWAITLIGVIAVPLATCAVLYGGALRAGQGRRRAAALAGGAAIVLGGWFAASGVIAGHGWYHTKLGHGVPWLPVAVVGSLIALLALRRVPAVARALAAPGTTDRLEAPHVFRVAGVAFLITMALGHLPAVFALPAGLGDITTGVVAAALLLRPGGRRPGPRAFLWLNAFGLTDLVVALALGALTAYQLIHTSPAGSAISTLPLALVPTAEVPLLIALHLTSVSALARQSRTPGRPTAPADVAETASR